MLVLLLACTAPRPEIQRDLDPPLNLVALVEPTMGTGGLGFGVGNSYPGAARPFGLVKVSPDTSDADGADPGFKHGGGYHYDDTAIQGFSHLHLHGIGLVDYGNIAFMPTLDLQEGRTSPDGYRATFSHEHEHASPGSYRVTLDDGDGNPGEGIGVELTATTHTALHRYTYPDQSEPTVIVDLDKTLAGGEALGGQVQWLGDSRELEGWMRYDGAMGQPFTTFFVARFDTDPSSWTLWGDGLSLPDSDEGGEDTGQGADDTGSPDTGETIDETLAEGIDLGAALQFEDPVVRIRVAISTVDLDGARANLEAEHDGFDLDQTRDDAREDWTEWLDVLHVWGGSETDQTLLASSLYKVLQMPTRFSDVDGRYTGFDQAVHVAEDFGYFTDFSLWDTYRTAHPLYTLLWPDHHVELLRSLARMAAEGGSLPRWPLATWDAGSMIGSPAHVVLGEAWQKGLRDFDEQFVFETALAEALGTVEDQAYGARPEPEAYGELGYYPADLVGGSVAWTQEVCVADAALAPAIAELVDAEQGQVLAERAHNWQNLYDEDFGYFHGRMSDGSWDEQPHTHSWESEYVEGNARHYLWGIPHEPTLLFETLGGDDATVERLLEFMEEGASSDEESFGLPNSWYWHGNEVDLHTAWLFTLAGRHDLTQEWTDWIVENRYGTGPDGLAGNDDGGTLTAWYVFAALGLYPLPGTDQYVLGAPRFSRIELPVDGGVFTIVRLGEGTVTEVLLNGEPLDPLLIQHDQIRAGSFLTFTGDIR
ncbi:MAG: GH92 family glycosyl hydrolase [Myxococcota bacterium]|jgi:predicted alpha-1,2-mannosidase|nr:GH92 family glycosyl hydrolase [Myxococcota bacterium]